MSARATPSRQGSTGAASSLPSIPGSPIVKRASGTPRSSPAPSAASAARRPQRSPSVRTPSAPSTPGADDDGDDWSRMSREALIAAVQREQAGREAALEKLAAATASSTELSQVNTNLLRDLAATELRLEESSKEQSRSEDDLLSRNEVLDRLRAQVRDLERERRDLERRYREQTASLDAERETWQNAEAHLKLRIASLVEMSRRSDQLSTSSSSVAGETTPATSVAEDESGDSLGPLPPAVRAKSPSIVRPASPPPPGVQLELEQLRAQLSSLNTVHESVVSSLRILQDESAELKRSNRQLLDENSSYEVLLGERTLSGALLSHGVFGQSWEETATPIAPDEPVLEAHGDGTAAEGAVAARAAKRRPASSADEPVRGGLDLAAELDRAASMDDADSLHHARQRSGLGLDFGGPADLAALRADNKSLREANKALSLYVSKIIDKIITTGAFEAVLATSAGPSPAMPPPSQPRSRMASPENSGGASTGSASRARMASPDFAASVGPGTGRRPTSIHYRGSSADFSPLVISPVPSAAPSAVTSPAAAGDKKRTSRMSLTAGLSALWSSTNTQPSPVPPAGFRPLVLSASTSSSAPAAAAPLSPTAALATPSLPHARRVSEAEVEDEDDVRERARLHAEMKLLGIDSPGSPSIHPNGPPVASLDDIVSSPGLDAVRRAEERDREARAALDQGRSSGFTESHSLGSNRRRPSSTRSNSSLAVSQPARVPSPEPIAEAPSTYFARLKRMSFGTPSSS